MKHWTLLILAIVGAAAQHSAAAEIYKCAKADGSVIFADSPCAADAEIVEYQESENSSNWREA